MLMVVELSKPQLKLTRGLGFTVERTRIIPKRKRKSLPSGGVSAKRPSDRGTSGNPTSRAERRSRLWFPVARNNSVNFVALLKSAERSKFIPCERAGKIHSLHKFRTSIPESGFASSRESIESSFGFVGAFCPVACQNAVTGFYPTPRPGCFITFTIFLCSLYCPVIRRFRENDYIANDDCFSVIRMFRENYSISNDGC